MLSKIEHQRRQVMDAVRTLVHQARMTSELKRLTEGRVIKMKIKSIALAILVTLMASGCENDIGAPPRLITTDVNGCQIWYYNPANSNAFNYVICPFKITPTKTTGSYLSGKVYYQYNVDAFGT